MNVWSRLDVTEIEDVILIDLQNYHFCLKMASVQKLHIGLSIKGIKTRTKWISLHDTKKLHHFNQIHFITLCSLRKQFYGSYNQKLVLDS